MLDAEHGYETMVFFEGCSFFGLFSQHYDTRAEAGRGHEEIVQKLLARELPLAIQIQHYVAHEEIPKVPKGQRDDPLNGGNSLKQPTTLKFKESKNAGTEFPTARRTRTYRGRGRDALVTVLGMLEREELVYQPGWVTALPNGFNMARLLVTNECGTVGCIAGWAHAIGGHYPFKDYPFKDWRGISQRSLAWLRLVQPPGFQDGTITVPQAARALRSYLTTGEPNWEEERC